MSIFLFSLFGLGSPDVFQVNLKLSTLITTKGIDIQSLQVGGV